MAAAALLTFAPLRNANPNPNPNPNPNFSRCGTKPPAVPSRLSFTSHYSQSRSLTAGRLDLARNFLAFDRRISRIVLFAASHDHSTHSDIEVEEEKNEVEREVNESQEAWKQTLESVREEAKKMKEISQEAYEVYSKKAMVMLKETSENLMIQADKAKHDLNIIAKELSEEGKVYLSTAAENSPDSVKDIMETFASAPNELKDISAVRDFHLGIPYGVFLVAGGFLSFMLTGSIPAIRFGVILGSALLALSVSSLRSWKSGQSPGLFLKGQSAIAAIIFLREWHMFWQKWSFSTSLKTLISGAMLAFYAYRIMTEGGSKDLSGKANSEN